jgi:hypothetical protein
MLRLVVKDLLIGRERMPIRHSLPPKPINSSTLKSADGDTDGELFSSYPLRWGVMSPLLATSRSWCSMGSSTGWAWAEPMAMWTSPRQGAGLWKFFRYAGDFVILVRGEPSR